MKDTLKNTKALAAAALMTAFTCVATMIIHIPTPTLGYIHPGDCMVLLSGIILGPVIGGAAAGLGSCLADAFTGYTIYIIPTFVIKALTAAIAGALYRKLVRRHSRTAGFLAAGTAAECNMVFGYFVNKIVKIMFLAGSVSRENFLAGVTGAVAGLIPDSAQGIAGILLGLVLLPALCRIPEVRSLMSPEGSRNRQAV